MPNREFIKEVQGKNEDELLKLAWWYDDLSEFIRNNDVQAYVDEVSQFLYRIDADRIIQQWNYYCREYQNGVFTSQEDKRRYYLMLIEFNDEMKGYLVDLHYYHHTSCFWLGRDHMFCRSWDADKLLKLMDIALRYNKEVQHIEDLIKGDPKEKVWPKELDNEAFKKIIERGIEAKLIEASTSGFKWNETKELLAYFAECISKRFGLSKKVYDKDNIATSWKPFEALFGVKNLKEAKQNWLRLNTMFTPNRYEEIDKLLNDVPTHL